MSLKATDLMISVMSLIVKIFHFHVGQLTYKIHNIILRLIHKFVYADINIKYTYLGRRDRKRGEITKMFVL